MGPWHARWLVGLLPWACASAASATAATVVPVSAVNGMVVDGKPKGGGRTG